MDVAGFDLGYLEREVARGEDQLKNGDINTGHAIIEGLYNQILGIEIDGLDICVRDQLFCLLRKCARLIYEALEKVQVTQPNAGDQVGRPREMNIEELIIVPDHGLQFSDLVGLKDVKTALTEAAILPNIWPGFVPNLHRWSGVLLFGPSGTGKSKILRALVNTVEERLDSDITFVQITNANVLGNYHGDTERNLSAIFQAAAQRRRCVIFFDEIDSLASNRNEATNSSEIRIINHFLTVLDGIQGTSPVVLIGTTNKPYNLDAAFLRRFQRKLFVDLPNLNERVAILRDLVTRLQKPSTQYGIDFEELGRMTYRFSPNDLCTLVTFAVQSVKCKEPAQQLVVRFESSKGKVSLSGLKHRKLSRPLTMNDLIYGKLNVSPSNEDKDIWRLEKFAKEHCQKLDFEEAESDMKCCTCNEFLSNPLESLVHGILMCNEFLFGNC